MKSNIITSDNSIKEALDILNNISAKNYQTLFVLHREKLLGTITDGDIRRGFLRGLDINAPIESFVNKQFKYIEESKPIDEQRAELLEKQISLVPILNKVGELVEIVDLSKTKYSLPIDAFIMAGGEGKRLRPLTENLPKPLLKVGDTPIMERNVNRLTEFGIKNLFISINYLGDLIKNHFGDGTSKGINIDYLEEEEFLGTVGSVSLTNKIQNDSVLLMNSDLLTNLDYDDFYKYFKKTEADIMIATVPYEVRIPYAVLENEKGKVSSLKEKPTYTYYSNAGIYLMKKEVVDLIPKGTKYDATDLIEKCLELEKNVISYPMRCYWLDIGKHEDFKKAQTDIEHIRF